jgi:ligand-binding sensor domain-containing protein/serine phosphatase RsbU (regulator of sigma subunit)
VTNLINFIAGMTGLTRIFFLFFLWLCACKKDGSDLAQRPVQQRLPDFRAVHPDELICQPDSIASLSLHQLPAKKILGVQTDTLDLRKGKISLDFIAKDNIVDKPIAISPQPVQEVFTSAQTLALNPIIRQSNGSGMVTGVNSSWFYFGSEQGMPGTTVNCLLDDSLQRLWIGTDGGLALYEGFNWQLFNSSNGLPHNYVTALEQYHDAYWVGTKGGLSVIGDSLYHYPLNKLKGISSEEVTVIFPDEEQVLIGTIAGLILKEKEAVYVFNKEQGLPGQHIKQISKVKNNQWLVSVLDGPVFMLKKEAKGKFVVQTISPMLENVSCHEVDPNGSTYFASLNKGMLLWRNDSLFSIRESRNQFSKVLLSDLLYRDEQLFISSFGGGFAVLNEKKEIFYASNDVPQQAAVLCNALVYHSDGDIIVGGAGGLLKKNKDLRMLKEGAGLKTSVPTAVSYDANGHLYVATIRGGIQIFKGGLRRNIAKENGLSSNNSPFIFHASSGKILVSTSGSGLDILMEEKVYNLKDLGKLQLSNVNCAIEDKKGRIWIGSNEDGLLLWENNQIFQFAEKHFLSNRSVYSLKELSDGSIAIGTNGDGLLIWNGQKMLRYAKAQGLKSSVVYPVVEEEGILLVGTYGAGLYLIHEREITCLNDSIGFPDNNILSITRVQRNQFLIGTGKGIIRMRLFPFQWEVMNKKDGLFFDDFQALAASGFPAGDVVSFGSGDVLTTVSNLNKMQQVRLRPRLSAVRAGETLLYSGLNGRGLNKQDKFIPELPYRSNRLKFYFGFTGGRMESQQQEIAFRLVGQDEGWKYGHDLSHQEYSNLYEGTYHFEYCIREAYGVWSEPVTFSLVILPPWYRSWWAYGLYVLLFVASLFGFAQWRNRQLIEKNLHLEKVVEDRTREVVRQKDEIAEGKRLVELQHAELEEKNHEIIQSINYAKHLQDAILPSAVAIRESLSEYFLLYLPKDIVAGDFYWFERIEKEGETYLYFAVADCTGHGVPGAMVSVVCSNALNRALLEFHLEAPGEILDKVRALVIETFRKSEGEVKDGMDISLVRYCVQRKEIQWAGANNPLWIIEQGEGALKEVKADKQPVGLHFAPFPFTTHSIQLKAGDCFYLISDGYADQFGGPNGKKFKSAVFKQLLLEHSTRRMEEQEVMVRSAFENWKGSYEQVDDVSVWGVRVV